MKALAILVALAVLAGPAHADKALAAKYYRAGTKAYQAQAFESAAENLDRAFQELPVPELAFSAAQAYRRAHRVKANVDHVVRAIELYKFYLSKVTEGGRVADAADNLGEMERELVTLGGAKAASASPAAPKRTRIAVTVSLVGVDAAVDLKELDERRSGPAITVVTKVDGTAVKADQMVDVTPGTHVVRAEAPGFAPLERTAKVEDGASELIELELAPLPASLSIRTEKGARVSIDGRGIGTAPVAAVSLPAGRHVFTIIRSGREAVAREVVLERGQSLAIDQPLVATERRRAVTWVLVGAGVLALFSTTTAIAAVHEDREARDDLDQIAKGNADPDVRDSYANARNLRDQFRTSAWLGGAAALGVVAVGAFLYSFDTPSAEGLRVTPMAAAGGGGGAALIGRF